MQWVRKPSSAIGSGVAHSPLEWRPDASSYGRTADSWWVSINSEGEELWCGVDSAQIQDYFRFLATEDGAGA